VFTGFVRPDRALQQQHGDVISEVYAALQEAQISEVTAHKAAEAVAPNEARFASPM
jgi:hypothetical protein